MARSDSGLKMIFADLVSSSRLREMKHALCDHRLVPLHPVLLTKAKQRALAIHASRDARAVQQHQRKQRMRFGLISRRVLRQQARQADRLVTDFLANQLFAARSFVAFVEKQVERLQNTVQSPRQFFTGGDLEDDPRLADFLFRPRQPLGDGCVGRQKCPADFCHAEAAEGLQCEGDLRLLRNQRMATHEHHPQPVVRNFLFREARRLRRGAGLFHQMDDLRFPVAENLFTPDCIYSEVAGSPHNPCGRIFGNSIKRPGLQRPGQGFLDHIFGQAQMFNPENPGQRGDHLSPLMTEKMFHHLGHFSRWWIQAVDPGRIHSLPGQAWSTDHAVA